MPSSARRSDPAARRRSPRSPLGGLGNLSRTFASASKLARERSLTRDGTARWTRRTRGRFRGTRAGSARRAGLRARGLVRALWSGAQSCAKAAWPHGHECGLICEARVRLGYWDRRRPNGLGMRKGRGADSSSRATAVKLKRKTAAADALRSLGDLRSLALRSRTARARAPLRVPFRDRRLHSAPRRRSGNCKPAAGSGVFRRANA